MAIIADSTLKTDGNKWVAGGVTIYRYATITNLQSISETQFSALVTVRISNTSYSSPDVPFFVKIPGTFTSETIKNFEASHNGTGTYYSTDPYYSSSPGPGCFRLKRAGSWNQNIDSNNEISIPTVFTRSNNATSANITLTFFQYKIGWPSSYYSTTFNIKVENIPQHKYILTLNYDGGIDQDGNTTSTVDKIHGTPVRINFPTLTRDGYTSTGNWLSQVDKTNYTSSSNEYSGDTNDTLTHEWKAVPTTFYTNLSITIREYKMSADMKTKTFVKRYQIGGKSGEEDCFEWSGFVSRNKIGNTLSTIIITPKDGYDFISECAETHKSNNIYYKTEKINKQKIQIKIYSKNAIIGIKDTNIDFTFDICKNIAKSKEILSGYNDSSFTSTIVKYPDYQTIIPTPASRKYTITCEYQAELLKIQDITAEAETEAKDKIPKNVKEQVAIESTCERTKYLSTGISYRNRNNFDTSCEFTHTITTGNVKFSLVPTTFNESFDVDNNDTTIEIKRREDNVYNSNNNEIPTQPTTDNKFQLANYTFNFDSNKELKIFKKFSYSAGAVKEIIPIYESDGTLIVQANIDYLNEEGEEILEKYIYSNSGLEGNYTFYKNSAFTIIHLRKNSDGKYGPARIPRHCYSKGLYKIKTTKPYYYYQDNNNWYIYDTSTQQWMLKNLTEEV